MVHNAVNLQKLEFFCEYSPSLSSLMVYLWTTVAGGAEATLSSQISELETLFKSTDGKFKLLVRRKVDRVVLTAIVIRDDQLSIRIKPGLTQFAALDSNTLLLRFALDSSQLDIAKLCKTVSRTSTFQGPMKVSRLSCLSCNANLTSEEEDTSFDIRSAPSANWQEVVDLWQCHDETYEQYFDAVTKQLKVPPSTLLFNMNVLEVHPKTDFSRKFSRVVVKDEKQLNCLECNAILGFVQPTNPSRLTTASFVSTQRSENERRLESRSRTHSFFSARLAQFAQLDLCDFRKRVKTCIYNHSVEDRQKNLAFLAETEDLCRVVTVKPLCHMACVVEGKCDGSAAFSQANKVLFSQMSYDLKGQNQAQVAGLVDFLKQISSVRRVTFDELEVSLEPESVTISLFGNQEVLQILREGQNAIPAAIQSVKKGLYSLTYIS